MVRVVNFPPLNKRFSSKNVPTYIKNMEGRSKPGDRTERLRESPYNGGKAPIIKNERRGMYNSTDTKRPAGRVSNIAPRKNYVFSQIRDDKMNLFGNTVSEQGIKKLSDLIQGVEVNDPSDTAWLEEKERISDAQRALGKTPKQIEDYLRVNKPLNREQNKTKKSDITPGQAGLSKNAMISTIESAIDRGVAKNLDGKTGIMKGIVELLSQFALKMDKTEIDAVADKINIIKPGFTWRDAPITKRFASLPDFDLQNPNSGFIYALILQTYKDQGSPAVMISITPAIRALTGLVNGIDKFKGLTDQLARTPDTFVDLENNTYVALPDVQAVSVDVSGNYDQDIFNRLTGGLDVSANIKRVRTSTSANIAQIKAIQTADVATLATEKTRDIDDLIGRLSGLKKDALADAIKDARRDLAKARKDVGDYKIANPVRGLTTSQRRVRQAEVDRLTAITRRVKGSLDQLSQDKIDMRNERRAIEAQFVIDRRAIDDKALQDIQDQNDLLADELRRIRALA